MDTENYSTVTGSDHAHDGDLPQHHPMILVVLLVVIVASAFVYFFRRELKRIVSHSAMDLETSGSTANADESHPLLLTVVPTHVSSELCTTAGIEMMQQLSCESIAGWSNELTLFVNGKKIRLVNPDPAALLAWFIRDSIGLKGTKLGCEEGGCGACSVILTKSSGEICSVNSCLRLLCCNDGMAITTVEDVGSINAGLSEEQSRLVAHNGTQCGYCTPGWVTNMHALNAAAGSGSRTKKEIEAYLDGNICRCTGYRPIVQAFQSFASDASDDATSAATGAESASKVCVERGCSTTAQAHCKSSGICCTSTSAAAGPVDVEDLIRLPLPHANAVANAAKKSDGSHCSSGSTTGCCSNSNSGSCGSNSQVATVRKASVVRSRDAALVRAYSPQPLFFHDPVSGKKWFRPVTLQQLCAVLRHLQRNISNSGSNEALDSVQLVAGNTSIGVTKYLNGSAPYNSPDNYSNYIDVNSIDVMTAQQYDANSLQLTVGAATTLSTLVALLQKYAITATTAITSTAVGVSDTVDHHSVFSVTANHLAKIANTQVRNAGSWAGNLMVFLRRKQFPSDAVLALTTANATLQICNCYGHLSYLPMEAFLTTDFDEFRAAGNMIVALTISNSTPQGQRPLAHCSTTAVAVVSSPLRSTTNSSDSVEFISETFKVAQRLRNAHAHVNAGFQFQVQHSNSSEQTAPYCVYARVVFGGVSQRTFVAYNAQRALTGAPLDAATLQRALLALNQDLRAVGKSEEILSNQSFRESVMQSCLYRAMLRCYGSSNLPSNLRSAVTPWIKPTSRGVEVFVPSHGSGDRDPVGKPVRKLEAPIQATGQAVYPSDEALPATGLNAAIVYSTKCGVSLAGIDFTAALAIPGVVSAFSAADIPAANDGQQKGLFFFVPIGEEVKCVGAPLAVVVATTEASANAAASMVRVSYQSSSSSGSIITTIQQAIDQEAFYDNIPRPFSHIKAGNPDSALQQSQHRVTGRVNAGGQIHFYMEAQSAVASVEDGDNYTVVCGTQDPSSYQSKIAAMLGVASNQVIVRCARTGGGFGGKLSGGIPAACAAALCAAKLGRTVRLFNNRDADMYMTGGREPWLTDYDVGFADDGAITALKYNMYLDAGITNSDSLGALIMGMQWADNAYYLPNYQADAKICFSNTPARTSMRAPGVVQSCFTTESVVERVATELNLPMVTVQERNFIKDGETTILGQQITNCNLSTVWNTLMQRSSFQQRLAAAQQYNAGSLWRKRGISVCPVKYGMGWSGYGAGIRLGVRNTDGAVILSHNGAEIGQGINTKCAQAVAMRLGIDLSLIRVTALGTDKVVNGGPTGGSGTSEVVVQAALNACDTLNARLAPYCASNNSSNRGSAYKNTDEWVKLLGSLPSEVSLNVEGWFSPSANPNGEPFQYFVYAACVSEVELDVLSGEVHVLAAEIVYDCGQSLNPAVDIGQIEGALVMGLGYFLSERVQYHETTGELLTAGTWEYKPSMVQDIPSTFNVTLLNNLYNSDGILGSKATGEPPYVVSNSIYFALKMAVGAARKDAGVAGFFDMEVPATVDVRQQTSLVSPSRFVMPC